MTTYKVRASRWERGWELEVEGVGVTQATTLDDAERMARDYVATDLGDDAVEGATFEVVIDFRRPAP